MKKAPKVVASNVWTCPNCANNPEFSHADMMKHLKEAHGIDPKTTKASKSMTMHLDAADHYSSSYEWTVGSLKFHQFTTNLRSKNDPMRHC